jgi:acyl transferase domain-containing protein
LTGKSSIINKLIFKYLDLYNMTSRMGKLKAIDKFDGAFFGIMSKIGDTVDPQARILLETTYEAIVDAGIC